MKKQTLRITLFTLMCVPFLMAGQAVSAADNTMSTSSSISEEVASEDTTTSSEEETATTTETNEMKKETIKPSTRETKDLELDKVEIKLDSTTIKGKVKETGELKLNATQDEIFGDVKVTGEFEVVENEFITLDKYGKWTALKPVQAKKTTLKYTLSQETQAELKKDYPDADFSKPFNTEEVTYSIEENKGEEADIQLEIVGGQLKTVEGQLKVKVKGGQELTGSFKPLTDKEPMTLTEDGTYEIGEKKRYEVLNEKITFILSDDSQKVLSNLEANKGKEVAKEQEVVVTKRAQKDITVTFKNKGINTQIGGKGRLLPNDTIESIKMDETEMKDLRFKPLNNNDFLTIDELGNWEAKKSGNGPLYPAVILSDTTMKKLEAAFPENDLNVVGEKVDVNISQSGGNNGGGTNNKKYEPVSNLPQTGEEKMKFAGVIGLVVIGLAAVLFFFKKKNSNDSSDEE
ncbi:MAG: LPXTG cell wall anchor domain-containing protein [Vagococcus sp.]|uniref:LPXTG cell wall anchor domain-containing protein n=1 Tax=Vagococcus sp. TaxID=1933889 RepID=UPI002FC829E6